MSLIIAIGLKKNPKTKITGSKHIKVVRLLIYKLPKHSLENGHMVMLSLAAAD